MDLEAFLEREIGRCSAVGDDGALCEIYGYIPRYYFKIRLLCARKIFEFECKQKKSILAAFTRYRHPRWEHLVLVGMSELPFEFKKSLVSYASNAYYGRNYLPMLRFKTAIEPEQIDDFAVVRMDFFFEAIGVCQSGECESHEVWFYGVHESFNYMVLALENHPLYDPWLSLEILVYTNVCFRNNDYAG